MEKTDFLVKLYKGRKIEIVQPNKNVSEAYIQRANESLMSAKTLAKVGSLKDSVALSYYSMYHCLIALLFRVGIKSENHTGSIILLKEIFDLDNVKLLKAKSDRIDKQYYVDFNVSKLETENAIKIAEEFISELMQFTALLTEDKINNYNKKVVGILTR